MNVRPLFWMMVGAGATLVGGAWGGRQFLPIPGEPLLTAPAKAAALLEAAVRPNSAYAAENVLRRTPWVKPKADPFGEKRAVVPRAVVPVVVNREPPPLVFPFEYVGKLTADGKETLFLSKGDQIYPAVVGETLDGLYRVEHIGSDSIELSHLPDARKMTIALGTITAKHAPGAATMPPIGMMGSIAPPPSALFSDAGVPQPVAVPTQPEGDVMQTMTTSPSLPESEVLQQMMAPPPLSPADGGQQSAAAPVLPESMPQGMMPPGMESPGTMPPGVPQ